MCGIFGFSGRPGFSVNQYKLMLLGLYNESRGKDSCGYYYNGNVEKGTGNKSLFSELIAEEGLVPGDLPGITFMGHTRKSTSGTNSASNAHPHVVNDDYVQTHNGVIKEIWPMCYKYDVNPSSIFVDSMALAHLIYKEGMERILSEYKGFAALAFTWKSNPEALYLYHGESRETKYGPIVPERPLYILVQEEGIYYSSMKESLDCINESKDKNKPAMLKYNTVYEIANGQYTGRKLEIDRENANIGINVVISKPATQPTTPQAQSVVPYTDPSKVPGTPHITDSYSMANKLNTTPIALGSSTLPYEKVEDDDEDNEQDMILSESYPDVSDSDINRVVYHQGKFHKVTKPGESFAFTLLDGEFVITRNRFIVDETLGKLQSLKPDQNRYYFINGIMIKSAYDYGELVKDKITGTNTATVRMISRKSRHPVFNPKTSYSGGDNRWYHYGNIVWKEEFNPKFSDRKYKIRNGVTQYIRTEHNNV